MCFILRYIVRLQIVLWAGLSTAARSCIVFRHITYVFATVCIQQVSEKFCKNREEVNKENLSWEYEMTDKQSSATCVLRLKTKFFWPHCQRDCWCHRPLSFIQTSLPAPTWFRLEFTSLSFFSLFPLCQSVLDISLYCGNLLAMLLKQAFVQQKHVLHNQLLAVRVTDA